MRISQKGKLIKAEGEFYSRCGFRLRGGAGRETHEPDWLSRNEQIGIIYFFGLK